MNWLQSIDSILKMEFIPFHTYMNPAASAGYTPYSHQQAYVLITMQMSPREGRAQRLQPQGGPTFPRPLSLLAEEHWIPVFIAKTRNRKGKTRVRLKSQGHLISEKEPDVSAQGGD